jgi:hypothetical protein
VTRGGPPAWGVGEVITTLHSRNISSYKSFKNTFDQDLSFGTT